MMFCRVSESLAFRSLLSPQYFTVRRAQERQSFMTPRCSDSERTDWRNGFCFLPSHVCYPLVLLSPHHISPLQLVEVGSRSPWKERLFCGDTSSLFDKRRGCVSSHTKISPMHLSYFLPIIWTVWKRKWRDEHFSDLETIPRQSLWFCPISFAEGVCPSNWQSCISPVLEITENKLEVVLSGVRHSFHYPATSVSSVSPTKNKGKTPWVPFPLWLHNTRLQYHFEHICCKKWFSQVMFLAAIHALTILFLSCLELKYELGQTSYCRAQSGCLAGQWRSQATGGQAVVTIILLCTATLFLSVHLCLVTSTRQSLEPEDAVGTSANSDFMTLVPM